MPDVDTLERTSARKVQVANLPPADSGRGFARLPERLMAELGLKEGDVIEIVGDDDGAGETGGDLLGDVFVDMRVVPEQPAAMSAGDVVDVGV